VRLGRIVRRLCIEIERDGVSLFLKEGRDLPFNFTKVFICPPYSFTAAIKRVRKINDHALLCCQLHDGDANYVSGSDHLNLGSLMAPYSKS
jgi:hypothetical protein